MVTSRTHRQLSRTSAHRQALLRNLVTQLFKHQSIQTTWPKAKEAQRVAEKLITLGKKNTRATERQAHKFFYEPLKMVPLLFQGIAPWYKDRPGGYTRVLRTEPKKEDQAPSAILELVDSNRDMRFALTAQTVARDYMLGQEPTHITSRNIKKILRYKEGAGEKFQNLVKKFVDMEKKGIEGPRDQDLKQLPVYNKDKAPENRPLELYLPKSARKRNKITSELMERAA